jgi:hypothetical protein
VLSRTIYKKRRGRRPLTAIAMLAVVASAIVVSGTVLAVHDEDFQLDANVVDDAAATQPFDWANFFNASGSPDPVLPDASRPGFEASSFDRDFSTNANGSFNTSDGSTFATGSKDTLPITGGWQCNFDNNVNSKTDVMNAYAVTYTDPVTEDEILYFALERNTNTGTGNVGFWFLQDEAACEATATSGTQSFTGDHSDGDLLVVSEFTNGGVVSTIQVYRWDGGANGSLNPNSVAGGVNLDCDVVSGGDSVCANVNTANITTPWLTANFKDGVGHTLRSTEFFEAGLNLTEEGLGGKCFNTYIADTRSSTSLTATIFDYSLGNLGSCQSSTTTTPSITTPTDIELDGTIDVTDDATVTVDGTETWSGTVQFYVCGPIASGTCTAGTGDALGSAVSVDQDTTFPITSPTATITEAGRYCFRAEFSGDETAGVPPSDDSSSNECFVINPVQPTLDTAAGSSPVDLGDPVTDTASLSGTANQPGSGGIGANGSINPTTAGGPAGGSITFALYKDDCTTAATGTANGSLVASVSGDGSYGPVSFTPDAPGDYSWKASYSGSSPNTLSDAHNAACDDTDEDVTVRQVPTEIATTQKVFPQDSATIDSSVAGVDLPEGGAVTFRLFGSTTGATGLENCQADDGTGELYEESFTMPADAGESETFDTDNTTVSVSDDDTYYWKVTYDPADSGFTGIQSDCLESVAIDFTNDAGPGSLFPDPIIP